MLELAQQYQSQIDCFNHVEFSAPDHTYTINNSKAESVTSILQQYVRPFERIYWATTKARQLGVTTEEILSKWEFSAKLAQIKGTLVHSFIEHQFMQTEFTYPSELVLETFGYDPLQDIFKQLVGKVDLFIQDIEDKMIPIASEFIVGDAEYLVGGTIDQLFYNKKSGQLEIWDWKTNKEIRQISKYNHLAPIQHVPDSELDRYSLQLSLYKLILERNTGLKLGDSYLTWFNEFNDKYRVFKVKDYSREAQLILVHNSKQRDIGKITKEVY